MMKKKFVMTFELICAH